MKFIITEDQFDKLNTESEIIDIDMKIFNEDFYLVRKLLKKLGNPLYNLTGNLLDYFEDDIGNIVNLYGSLDMSGSENTELPKTLKLISKSLDISLSNIEKLPKGLKIGKGLYASGSNLMFLEDNFSVVDYLDLSNCKKMKSLPKGLIVVEHLDISNTFIREIPSDISIEFSLSIKNTPITRIPENLKLKGDLDIRETDIRSLPSDIYCDTLICSGTPLYETFTSQEILEMYPNISRVEI